MTVPDLVPLERLLALERQFLPLLPDNPPSRDLRALVLEAIARRRSEALERAEHPDGFPKEPSP
jgi:hypothetical protein